MEQTQNALSMHISTLRALYYAVFFSIAMMAYSSVVCAERAPLESISSAMQKRPGWQADSTEVSYVAGRCSALFATVSVVFSQSPTTNDKQTGQKLSLVGLKLTFLARELSLSTGMSSEVFERRLKDLVETYTDAIKSNRSMHNNMFHGTVGEDYNFCNEFDGLVREVMSRAGSADPK